MENFIKIKKEKKTTKVEMIIIPDPSCRTSYKEPYGTY